MPTETMEIMATKTSGGREATAKPRKDKTPKASPAERELALEMIRRAKEQDLDLTGPDGLLKQFTKTVLETALDEETAEHLGRARHEKSVSGRAANKRNGATAKTVVTDAVGPVRIEVPRDRDGSFEPVVVKKRQRRLNDVDSIVLSLYAKGPATGEISAHFKEIYGASVSKETVSRITVVAETSEWSTRPLDRVYAAVSVDAIHVKVRDGQVANRAFYAAVGVDLEGDRDVLGIWGSPAAEGARGWLAAPAELKNRGVEDVFFLVCDGLKVLPDAVGVVWPRAVVQTCVIHLMRNTYRYAVQSDWSAVSADLRAVYTAVNETAAAAARDEMLDRWSSKYPAIRSLWMDAWERFIPFLDYDVEIRRVICSTNAIRMPQRPVPSRGPGARAFPGRTRRSEVPVPDGPVDGPDGQGPTKMGRAMEARAQRVRHHLRRPLAGRQELTMEKHQLHT